METILKTALLGLLTMLVMTAFLACAGACIAFVVAVVYHTARFLGVGP